MPQNFEISTDTTSRVRLGNEDRVVVTRTGAITTTGETIVALQNQHNNYVYVAGKIASTESTAVVLNSSGVVHVAANGSVYGHAGGISIGSMSFGELIRNSGNIGSFNGSAISGTDNLAISNNASGIIASENGIGISFTNGSLMNRLYLDNEGVIKGLTGISSSRSNDYVKNTGSIQGTGGQAILFADGDDTYEGRTGTVLGLVDMGAGNDVFEGGVGSETIIGGEGNDLIDGGDGEDYLKFENTNNITVDLRNGSAQDTGEGQDTIRFIEHLIGGSGNDVFIGNQAANTLEGGAGNDRLDGGVGNDRVSGDEGDDYLVGSAGGNDVFNGGEDRDTVSYWGASAGITVNLTTGARAGAAEGDTYDSIEVIDGTKHADTLEGDAGENAFWGDSGADQLKGHGGNDRLNGGEGSDILDGGAGIDTLIGDKGNDTFYVDNARDVVTEIARGGRDTVLAKTSYALSAAAEVEVLKLSGVSTRATANLTGSNTANEITGHGGRNTLKGQGGNDSLSAGAGNDKLFGGAGKDTLKGQGGRDAFVFDTQANARTNVDKIVDFKSSDDSIFLDNAVFAGLGRGTTAGVRFNDDMFVEGTRAQDREDRIVYDQRSGSLYYDADGTGSIAQVKIATLTNKAKLYHHDFFVV